jgi:protein-disulfide isomerase-like protein with CxxC motif
MPGTLDPRRNSGRSLWSTSCNGQAAIACSRTTTSSTMFLERARTSEDFVGELMERLEQLREVVNAPNGMASLAALLRYASMVTDTRPERLRVVAQALGPKSEVILMSAAEEWMMEGRAKGKAEAVLSVLEARGLAVSVSDRERIAKCTDLALLDSWLRRVGTVATVAEVLAD